MTVGCRRELFWLGFCLLLVVFFCPATGRAAQQKVRVAFFTMNDYNHSNFNEKGGYESQYLEHISKYTNLSFEYVPCKTWANALNMLRDKKVDLLGTMQKSEQREKQYTIGNNAYGMTVAELVALPGKKSAFQDYAQIAKSVIGTTSDYVRIPELKAVFRKNKIQPQLKFYKTQEALLHALYTGKIDLAAANSHTLPKELQIVDKYYYSSIYFASWKGNTSLIHKIDEALLKIELYEPSFDDDLIKNTFPGLAEYPFSIPEISCIEQEKEYTVYLDCNTQPIVWYDQKTDQMKGILVDLCDEISKETGLHITVRPREEQPAKLSDTDITYRTQLYDVEGEGTQRTGRTESIFDTSFQFYREVGSKYSNQKKGMRFAIVGNRNFLKQYILNQNKSAEIVECDTPADCIERLKKHQVDCMVLNSYVADYQFITKDLEQFVKIPTERVSFGIGLDFHGKDRKQLASIINKGVERIDEQRVNEIANSYALSTVPDLTLAYVLKSNIYLTIAGFVLLGILMVVVASALTYANVMRHQQQKVQDATEAKNQFFARMSHDMRTPMNGILGMTRLALDEKTVDEMKQDLHKIEASGEYMLSLINDSLDIQKVESGKMHLEKTIVNIGNLLDSTVEMVQDTAKSRKIMLVVNDDQNCRDKYVRADVIRLKQILTNLLSNALKFTPPKGLVNLEAVLQEQTEQTCKFQFVVRDNGVGMSQDFLDTGIFQSFSQDPSIISNTYAGTGLGLSIVKLLVEMMGGSITVKSKQNMGSEFTVVLEFTVVTPEEVAVWQREKTQVVEESGNLAGKRILLLEDHPLNAEITIRLLQKKGCQVDWAENGKIGVDKYREADPGTYALVLMDVRMPVMNGLEATREIRSSGKADSTTIPIIAMSANAFEEDIARKLAAGMNDHLAKPVEFDEMYHMLNHYINEKCSH